MASCRDLHFHNQKPATSSFVSANGPSITVCFPPENLTRAPFELGWSPSPASITPAFANSSLNLPILVRISLLGRTPASDSLLAFTITMKRIFRVSFPRFVRIVFLPYSRSPGAKIDNGQSLSLLPFFTCLRGLTTMSGWDTVLGSNQHRHATPSA